MALGTMGGVGWVVDEADAKLFGELRFLLADLCLELIEPGDDLKVSLDVFGSEGVRALEHHVFKQVRDAGDARALIDGADPGDPTAGDVRITLARDQQQSHAVVEDMLLYLDLLRRQEKRREGEQEENSISHGCSRL